jgi:hypothetical protein
MQPQRPSSLPSPKQSSSVSCNNNGNNDNTSDSGSGGDDLHLQNDVFADEYAEENFD